MRIQITNTTAEIEFNSKKEFDQYQDVRRGLKLMAPGARYMKSYKHWVKTKGKAGWNGMVDLVHRNGVFATGMLPLVLSEIYKIKINPSVVDNRWVGTFPNGNVTVSLRDYQEEAFKAGVYHQFSGIWWPRGVFEIATGGGKTELAVSIFEKIPRPTLFLVHRKTLAHQTVKRFKKYVNNVGILADGEEDIRPRGITVASIQSLISKEDQPNVRKLLKMTEQVFFDEAHMIAANVALGNSFVKTAAQLERAFYRWGLTATPFKRDTYSNWLLAGATGGVLYSEPAAELIDKGYLTPAKVIMVKSASVSRCPKKWPACYDIGIVLNRGRNLQIVEWMKKNPSPGFVLCNQVAHAKIILEEATKAGLKVDILQGSSSTSERNAVLKELKRSRSPLDFVICTTIFDEGIDFPELRSLILAGGGKSEIKALQRIGRGLRLYEGKKELVVVDFLDKSAPRLREHSEKRRDVWVGHGFRVVYP